MNSKKINLTKPMHFEMFGCMLTFCKPWARNCQNSRLLETHFEMTQNTDKCVRVYGYQDYGACGCCCSLNI